MGDNMTSAREKIAVIIENGEPTTPFYTDVKSGDVCVCDSVFIDDTGQFAMRGSRTARLTRDKQAVTRAERIGRYKKLRSVKKRRDAPFDLFIIY